MARIGIYGGTFNPPHIGHIAAANYAVSALKLDVLLLIPDRIAPHKALPADSPTPEQRMEMLRLAAAGSGALLVSDLELRREEVSYTCRTVAALREQYAGDTLILLMGTDMFLSFLSWREPERIMQDAELAVFGRAASEDREAVLAQKARCEAHGARVTLLDNPTVEISSTDVRRMMLLRCASPFLNPEVAGYIRRNGLYGVSRDYSGLSEQALMRVVERLLTPNRVAHVYGCRDTAVRLAEKFGADKTDAARAALLHDATKALNGALQLTLCREYGILSEEYREENPATIHAFTGSLAAKRVFGENAAVADAIRWHTTGKPEMTTLEKILFLADCTEPSRSFTGVDALRACAWEDLDRGMLMALERKIHYCKMQGKSINPASERAAEDLRRKGIQQI